MSAFKVLSGSKNSLLNELNIRKSRAVGQEKGALVNQSIQIKFALAKVLGHEEGFRKGMVIYKKKNRLIFLFRF